MGRTKLDKEMSLSAWLAYWMKSTEGYRVMTTDAKYEEILNGYINPVLGDLRLREVTEEAITAFLAEEKRKGRSNARLGTVLSVLSSSLTSAVNHRLIPRNPCQTVRMPGNVQEESAILADTDLEKLIEAEEGNPYLPIVLFMLFMGLRTGEAIGLDWEKIDFAERTVTIDQQAVSYYAKGHTRSRLVPYTKNRVCRKLPICDAAWEILEKQAEGTGNERKGPVFPAPDGGRIKYASLYYAFRKMMAGIGREDLHPHSLRHTAASTLLSQTGDLLLVRDYLGHRSLRSSERYPEATEAEKRKAAEALDEFFSPYLPYVFGTGSAMDQKGDRP